MTSQVQLPLCSIGSLKSHTEIQKWRNAFDTYDHDSDGYISPADFQKNPNLPLQKVQLLKGMARATSVNLNGTIEFDRDNNNLIDFGEFVEAISMLDVLDIRRSFEGFDVVDIQLEFEKFAILVCMPHYPPWLCDT